MKRTHKTAEATATATEGDKVELKEREGRIPGGVVVKLKPRQKR